MKLFILRVLFLSLFTTAAAAQIHIGKIKLETDKVDNVQSFGVRDTLFVFFNEYADRVGKKKTFIADSAGNQKELDIRIPSGGTVLHVSAKGNKRYIYYLYAVKKDYFVDVVTLHKDSTSITEAIGFNDVVLGVWGDANIFTIALYDDDEDKLKVFEFAGDQIVREKTFDLNFSLKYYLSISACIGSGSLTTTTEGAARLKLYKTKDIISMSVDEVKIGVSGPAQTTLHFFNLETGKQSIDRVPAMANLNFVSFLKDSILYRVTMSKKVWAIEEINITTKKNMVRHRIARDTTFKDILTYVRLGKYAKLAKGNFYNLMTLSPNVDASIVPVDDFGTDGICVGLYFPASPGVPAIGFNPIVSLLSVAIKTAIYQMGDKEGDNAYAYMQNLDSKTFTHTTSPALSWRQIIDDYDYAQQEKKIVYTDRYFTKFQRGVAGTYVSRKDLALDIIKFVR